MLSMSMIERIIPEMAAKRLRELIITFALTKLFLEVFSAAAARSDPEMMYIMPPHRGYHTLKQMGAKTPVGIISSPPREMWKRPFMIWTAPKAFDSLMKKLCVGPTSEDGLLGITFWAGCMARGPFVGSVGKGPLTEFLGVVILFSNPWVSEAWRLKDQFSCSLLRSAGLFYLKFLKMSEIVLKAQHFKKASSSLAR